MEAMRAMGVMVGDGDDDGGEGDVVCADRNIE